MDTHTATDGRAIIHPGTPATMTIGTHLTIHTGTGLIQAGGTIHTGQVTITAFTMDTIQDITMTVITQEDRSITAQGAWLTTTGPSQWAEAWARRPAQQGEEG